MTWKYLRGDETSFGVWFACCVFACQKSYVSKSNSGGASRDDWHGPGFGGIRTPAEWVHLTGKPPVWSPGKGAHTH